MDVQPASSRNCQCWWIGDGNEGFRGRAGHCQLWYIHRFVCGHSYFSADDHQACRGSRSCPPQGSWPAAVWGYWREYGVCSLDYTTQAVWTDTLRVAAVFSVAPAQGLLTYRTAETGTVSAHAAGLTTTVTVKINDAGAVTIVKVHVVPVVPKRVVVLTIGSDIVTVDGHATRVDAAPEIVAGRTFVPIRFIAETFGSTVTWLPETRGITIILGTTTIGLQIGNKTAVINGKIVALDAAPYIKNSRSMVPLRVISESFGSDVAWNAAKHVITITHLLP